MSTLTSAYLQSFNLPTKRVGVIGDVMLDIFTRGKVERLSPEAPVPIVLMESEQELLGGAANVARGIEQLGNDVDLFGVCGKDFAGTRIEQLLASSSIASHLLIDTERPTTVKHRIVANGRHLARVDWEVNTKLSEQAVKVEINKIRSEINEWSGVVIADYAKGYLSQFFYEELLILAREAKIPIIVDSKPVNSSFVKDVTVFTPNKKEALDITGMANVYEAGERIRNMINSPVIITCGEEGMLLFDNMGVLEIKTHCKKVVDVSGAGDTVVAALITGLTNGLELRDAAQFASRVAGLAVEKPGTATVTLEEFKRIYG